MLFLFIFHILKNKNEKNRIKKNFMHCQRKYAKIGFVYCLQFNVCLGPESPLDKR
jgi:hypothetical protein